VTKRNAASFETADALVEQLRQQLAELAAGGRHEVAALTARVAALEADVGELQQLLQTTEAHAAQLTSLYVATYQLHASLELDDVRRAIAEIAINLLGAKRYALLVRDPDSGVIEIAARSEGLSPPFAGERYDGGDAMVDAGLRDGVMRMGPMDGSRALVTVPLAARGEVLGTLVIVTLLPQKGGIMVEDRELLDVIAAHAASALLAARSFHERTRKLRTLEGLMDLLRPGAGGRPP
jgi:GAF domain-containing protein